MATTGGLTKKRSTTGTLYGMIPNQKINKQGIVKGLANPVLKYDGTRNLDEAGGYNAEMNHKR